MSQHEREEDSHLAEYPKVYRRWRREAGTSGARYVWNEAYAPIPKGTARFGANSHQHPKYA
jgi:hypothetical protein